MKTRRWWSEAVKNIRDGKPFPKFNYSDIRPKGMPLKTTKGGQLSSIRITDIMYDISRMVKRK